jgi:hypothetical protein
MTEAKWLAADDVYGLEAALVNLPGPRKPRLFVCACARAFPWTPPAWAPVIDLCEQYVDGLASREELDEAGRGIELPAGPTHEVLHVERVWDLLQYIARPEPEDGWRAPGRTREISAVQELAGWIFETAWESQMRAGHVLAVGQRGPGQKGLLAILRDVVGNPFHPLAADPAWLTPAVVGLARSAYEERAFDLLPILADALEEAGCTNREVLGHCRQTGEHVRGCWLIDLLLGKE